MTSQPGRFWSATFFPESIDDVPAKLHPNVFMRYRSVGFCEFRGRSGMEERRRMAGAAAGDTGRH